MKIPLKLAPLALGLVAFSAAGSDASTQVDYSFELGRGFTLRIEQVFAAPIDLAAVLEVYADDRNHADVSDVVESTERLRRDADTVVLKVHSRKHGRRGTLTWNCDESVTESRWSRDCRLDLKNAKNRAVFMDATTHLQCAQEPTAVRCVAVMTGSPKGQSILFVTRSPQELAASGASESVHAFGSLALMVTQHLRASQASVRNRASALGKVSTALYASGKKSLPAGKKRWRVTATDSAGGVRVLAE